MPGLIQIENLVRKFGEIVAVDNVSFSVSRGEMFGLVGPDGAGKTTLVKTLCGLLNPTRGKVKIFGLDIVEDKARIQKKIGYLSQKFTLYEDLSVDENIEFFAEIHDVRNFESRRDELLEFTRLKPFRDRIAENLSGGMKQKLALACSLIHNPEILLLDEPTTGVDPVSRRDFWKILAQLIRQGITILMTTPYLDEAERCNRVALMNNGRIMKLDTPENIRKSTGKIILEIVCSQTIEARDFLRDKLSYDAQSFGDRIDVMLDDESEKGKIIGELKKNFEVISERIKLPSLENVFIHLIREKKIEV